MEHTGKLMSVHIVVVVMALYTVRSSSVRNTSSVRPIKNLKMWKESVVQNALQVCGVCGVCDVCHIEILIMILVSVTFIITWTVNVV